MEGESCTRFSSVCIPSPRLTNLAFVRGGGVCSVRMSWVVCLFWVVVLYNCTELSSINQVGRREKKNIYIYMADVLSVIRM